LSIRIGNISISLTAETASFTTEMTKASQLAMNSSKNIERSFNIMGAAIVAATGTAVGALGVLVEKTQNVVFALQKQAQQAGVSVEMYSKLAYAAKVAGMDQEQMAVIMTRISKSSFEAESGNKKAAAAYKELGVSTHNANGTLKDAGTLAIEVAQALAKFKDSAGKTGLETTIMGRSGAMAASFMGILATRFDEVSATAQKLGLVINGDVAAGAQKLHDNIVMLEGATLGLSIKLLTKLSPALDELIGKVVAFVSVQANMDKIGHIGEELAEGIRLAGQATEFLINHFDEVKHVIEALALIRFGGMFGPMIAGASETAGFFGKLAIASGNLAGRLLGIKGLGKIMAPLAADAAGYAGTLTSLAKSEGVAATASLAMGDAMAAAATAASSVVLPVLGIVAGLADIVVEIKTIHNLNSELKKDGLDWTDVWQTGIRDTIGSLGNLKKTISELNGPGGWGSVVARVSGDLARQSVIPASSPRAPGLPSDYFTNKSMHAYDKPDPLKDAHGLDTEGADKFASLTKRLEELRVRAKAAQDALNLVGASPEDQQKAEIDEKYHLFLAEEKKLLDQLSPAKRAAAEASAKQSITVEVQAKAAEKYQKALYDLSVSLHTSTQEHESMAAAVGKSAQAMQDAVVKAKVAQEMQKAYGNGWEKDPAKVLDAEMTGSQIRDDLNKANSVEDAKALNSSQLQLEAQDKLNAAILRGSDAYRDAGVESQKAALKAEFADRGDTDTAGLQARLDLIDKISEKEREAGDLQFASTMDPALKYKEQTKAINDAVAAAQRFGLAIDYHEVLTANKQAWLDYKAAQDKTILGSGDMVDGLKVALDQMARDVESAAQQMHDAVQQAVGSLNDAIAKAMMVNGRHKGQQIKQEFSNAFKSIGGSLAKRGLEKAEQGVLQKFGFGGKPDGSASKPFSVKIVKGSEMGQGAGGVLGGIMSKLGFGGAGTPDGSSGKPFYVKNASDSGAGGLAKGLFGGSDSGDDSGSGSGSGSGGFLGGLIQGMFADGTDSLIPGMPAIVGEKGPELFIPPSSGAIVPNSKLKNGLGGHTIHNHIDARGSNDPAQTIALIDGYMQKKEPQIIQKSMAAYTDHNARIAPRARR
jgi:hypothetical protein